ncbi:MAG: hypothetical protein KC613_21170 [Myxococcales bacterium]|nr:hypothetical protein [Myxococcales bacterium]MCB9523051.1 hypothetical protein [Myxococcales bacterium]
MFRSLILALLPLALAVPALAQVKTLTATAPTATKTTTYKLFQVAEMKAAWDILSAEAPKLADPKWPAPEKTAFKESTTLLYAAEIARKLGKTSIAQTLATHAKTVAVSNVSQIATLKTDGTLQPHIAISEADIAKIADLTNNPTAWQTAGWEPDPL